MIADVEVRLATVADAPDIAAMSRDYIEHGLPCNWGYDRVAAAINDPQTNVAVVGEFRGQALHLTQSSVKCKA